MINDHAFFLLVSQNIFLVFEYLPIHISYHIPKSKFVEKCSIQKSQIFASFKLKSNQVYFINYLSCFKYGNFLLLGQSFCDFMKFYKECLYLVYWTFDQIWATIIRYYLGSIADGADLRNLRFKEYRLQVNMRPNRNIWRFFASFDAF